MLVGKISQVSDIPTNEEYYADLELTNGLITNYNDTLKMCHELYGTGEILTEETSLLSRYFNPIKALFKEYLN